MALIWYCSHANKPYFDKNAFALGLVLKVRIFGSRKCLYNANFRGSLIAVVLQLSSITSVLFFSQCFYKLVLVV